MSALLMARLWMIILMCRWMRRTLWRAQVEHLIQGPLVEVLDGTLRATGRAEVDVPRSLRPELLQHPARNHALGEVVAIPVTISLGYSSGLLDLVGEH